MSGVVESSGTASTPVATTAGGSRLSKTLRIICVAGALYVPGTASTAGIPSDAVPVFTASTTSGAQPVVRRTASAATMELRRLSGMTWDQLARLFNVTRRTIHFWASGKALSASNEERLHRVLAAIRMIDRGNARENRAALFTPRPDGRLLFDLIQAGHYGEASSYSGDLEQHRRPALFPLSPSARASRVPLQPADLADALQDSIHRDVGRSRVAKVHRAKRTKSGDKS